MTDYSWTPRLEITPASSQSSCALRRPRTRRDAAADPSRERNPTRRLLPAGLIVSLTSTLHSCELGAVPFGFGPPRACFQFGATIPCLVVSNAVEWSRSVLVEDVRSH